MVDRAPRLGDVVEDYCPRCRLLLNHDVSSLAGTEAAKVTCRTCHNTHDFKHGQVPPKRKKNETKKLVEQVMAGLPLPPSTPAAPPPVPERPRKRDLWAEMERIKANNKK
jgi:hypothetical protein